MLWLSMNCLVTAGRQPAILQAETSLRYGLLGQVVVARFTFTDWELQFYCAT